MAAATRLPAGAPAAAPSRLPPARAGDRKARGLDVRTCPGRRRSSSRAVCAASDGEPRAAAEWGEGGQAGEEGGGQRQPSRAAFAAWDTAPMGPEARQDAARFPLAVGCCHVIVQFRDDVLHGTARYSSPSRSPSAPLRTRGRQPDRCLTLVGLSPTSSQT